MPKDHSYIARLQRLSGWTQLRLAYVADINKYRLAAALRGEVELEPEEIAALEEPLLQAIGAKRAELDTAIREANHPADYPSGRSTPRAEVTA
jgi:hypothetical protein